MKEKISNKNLLVTIMTETLKKYMSLSLPVKAAFWFTICNFLQKGISMITTPVFTRILSTEEYGRYSTYIAWENIILLIVTLNLQKSLMNLYTKYNNKQKVLSIVFGLQIFICSIWLIIAFIFKEEFANLLGLSPLSVCCMFTYCLFQSGINSWSLYKRYTYGYRLMCVVTLIIAFGSSFGGLFGVLFIFPSAESRIIASTLTVAAVGLFIYIITFKRNKAFYNKEIWKFSLGFCIALMPHYLSEFILQSSDKIMINYMCGASDVAIYSVAYSVGSLINLVTSAINASFSPYEYQKIKEKQYDLLAKRATQVTLFVGVMLCVIMFFSKEIVFVFGGKKYLSGASSIIPICLGSFFGFLFQMFSRVQEYHERKLLVVLPSILCAVLNLVLNYIFIGLAGYQAAAYTTFVCYLLFCCLHYLFYKKTCKDMLNSSKLFNIKSLSLISGTIIIGGLVLMFLNDYMFLKYCILAGAFVGLIHYRHKILLFIREIFKK